MKLFLLYTVVNIGLCRIAIDTVTSTSATSNLSSHSYALRARHAFLGGARDKPKNVCVGGFKWSRPGVRQVHAFYINTLQGSSFSEKGIFKKSNSLEEKEVPKTRCAIGHFQITSGLFFEASLDD